MTFDDKHMKYEVRDDHLNVMDTRRGGQWTRYLYSNLPKPEGKTNNRERYISLTIWDSEGMVIFDADDTKKGFVEFADALDRAWMKHLD